MKNFILFLIFCFASCNSVHLNTSAVKAKELSENAAQAIYSDTVTHLLVDSVKVDTVPTKKPKAKVYFTDMENDFEVFAPLAKLVYLTNGIPPSIQLAQAFCETGFGRADTIGKMYNNVFSIMDCLGDDWTGDNGPMTEVDGKTTYLWRKYPNRLSSLLDYIAFIKKHQDGHLWQPWEYWIQNPIKYGNSKYWTKIGRTIEKYKLYQYDGPA